MRIELSEKRGNIAVRLSAIVQGRDGIFWLYGGEKPHIGAVSVGFGTEKDKVIVFPGHREDIIVRELAEKLTKCKWMDHAVICGGIHYDDIPKEWIQDIILICRELGDQLLEKLNSV